MKLIELSKQKGIDLFSLAGYEEIWKRDKSQPRLVSTIDPDECSYDGIYKPAFHLDTEYPAGIWGAVNNSDDFIIKPQYLFAFPFKDGRAIVAKGNWEYRNNWQHEGKGYSGYWYEKDLWGVVDRHNNEVVDCRHQHVCDISHENRKDLIVKIMDYKHATCELINASTGECLVNKSKGYSDFGYFDEDEYGQVISVIGGSIRGYYSPNHLKMGVFNLNTCKDIIIPQYGYVDIEGEFLYRVGDTDMHGDEKTGILINSRNEKLLGRNDIAAVCSQNRNSLRIRFMDCSEKRYTLERDKDGIPIRLI
ncbi:MAG: WG repeat-containing protein [Candidatus Saccharibacteria bacterium]|nr:WG repeat-containing protein [Candidatus Saccharibacteria bacterium]